MKTTKRLLLGITLGMLLVGCTADPIEEQEQVIPKIQINIPQPSTGTFCTYTIFPITTPLTPNGAYDNDGTIFLIDNTIIATTVPIVTPIPQGEYLRHDLSRHGLVFAFVKQSKN